MTSADHAFSWPSSFSHSGECLEPLLADTKLGHIFFFFPTCCAFFWWRVGVVR